MSEEWIAQQGGHPLWTQEDHPLGQEVRDAVDALDDQSRAIIELRMWGQYTFTEIAKMLGLASRGSAHVLYQRALAKLQKGMSE